MPLFSLLYDQPEILVPGVVLSLAFPLLALETPIWVFYRRMDFVRQRLLQSVGPVVSFFVTIGLALWGAGLWSLVIGSAAASLTAALVAVANSPYKLRFRYERGAVREYGSFSWPLMFGALTAVLAGQIPLTVASRSLGATAIGAIALAMTITAYTRRVDDIVTQTLYPAICAVKDRTDALFESFSKSNRLALLWGFPCGIALALFAADIVRFLLGEEWRLAIPVIQVLGVTAAVDLIGFNWTAFARARGETRPLAVGALAMLIAMVGVGVPLLLSEGLIGYAIALAVATLAVLVVRAVYLVRLFPAFKIATHISRAILPTVPAALVVLGERALAGGPVSPGRVLAEVIAYGAVVAAGTLLAERALLREAAGYLRRAPAPVTPATG
jgi:PST family polysaccharide transporter